MKQETTKRVLQLYLESNESFQSDTSLVGLDLRNEYDAFLALLLGVLYAFPILPRFAEAVVTELKREMNRKWCCPNWFKEKYLQMKHLSHKEALSKVREVAPELYSIIENKYRRIPRVMSLALLKAGYMLCIHGDGDCRKIYSICSYNGEKTIRTLMSWGIRLHIKAFWLAREMRMQSVWANPSGLLIEGKYCCVVDIQVKRAMITLDMATSQENDLFELSARVWMAFGEYYDMPLLWYGRVALKETKSLPLFT